VTRGNLSRTAAVVMALGLLAFAPACKDDSYAVVSVVTQTDSVSGVAQFRVYVGNDADTDMLYYPKQPSESLTLDTSHPVTFSVQFDDSREGRTRFEVEPLDVAGATLGYGKSDVEITKGKVFDVTIHVFVGATRPQQAGDGGASDGGGELVCDPYAPSAACGEDRTCGLLCNAGEPAVGMCYLAGQGKPGDTCTSNSDCSPGSQCFALRAVGCAVKTCLRFCDQSDLACAETGAFCNVPIPCGSGSTFWACSRPCDPTGSGTTGCAAGLACFVYGDETTDCACPGLAGAGAACTQNHGCNGEAGCSGCAAGLSCVVPTSSTTGAGVCRPICNLAAPACPSGTTCRGFAGATKLTYGFCE
jgi:hypothetical protein